MPRILSASSVFGSVTPASEPRDEDRRQDGGEDQRDQQVADQPEKEERDRQEGRDPDQQPGATTERLEPSQAGRVAGRRLVAGDRPRTLLILSFASMPRPTDPRRRRGTAASPTEDEPEAAISRRTFICRG
jgi:hypothetical protein